MSELTVSDVAHPPRLKRLAGDAPVVPIVMIMAGAYLGWFGVHYWRDQSTRRPTDPVKAVLQGKPIPAPNRETPVAQDIDAAQQAATAAAAAPESGTAPAVGSASGDAIAQDAAQYVGKVPYVWGGASPVTGWDCSGYANYVLCHDLGIDIPGIPGGDFDGKTHGPNVASWIAAPGLWRQVAAGPSDKIQAGDLALFGPNEHMCIMTSQTALVCAADPASGTVGGTLTGQMSGFAVPPLIVRLNAVVQQAGGDAAANQGIARLLAGNYGWSPSQSPSQWQALVSLWARESGWSVTAENPSSGAYGIPQALPGSKMASVATNWKTSAKTQITWGLEYIKQTYETPEAAWQHEQQHGWY